MNRLNGQSINVVIISFLVPATMYSFLFLSSGGMVYRAMICMGYRCFSGHFIFYLIVSVCLKAFHILMNYFFGEGIDSTKSCFFFLKNGRASFVSIEPFCTLELLPLSINDMIFNYLC